MRHQKHSNRFSRNLGPLIFGNSPPFPPQFPKVPFPRMGPRVSGCNQWEDLIFEKLVKLHQREEDCTWIHSKIDGVKQQKLKKALRSIKEILSSVTA